MTRKPWLRALVRIAGAIALGTLIWFGAPFIRFAEGHPLEDPRPRLAAILILFMLLAVAGAYRLYRRQKRAARIARGMGPDADDPPPLAARMNKVLAVLRGSRGGLTNILLDLPWYFVIGAPGSGKTTALANSGLTFPLAAGGAPCPIAGVGAARRCEWWFSEDAVLIDAGGRDAAQGPAAEADEKGWLAFLALLRRNRRQEPINGVFIAISVEDLLTRPPAEAAAQAAAIRSNLIELRQRLGVDFPVYALFTKADLILGFSEFFDALDAAGRAQVWGATFQTANKPKPTPAKLEAEFEALIARLNRDVADRLAEEKDPVKRALLFGFPAQMEALRGRATSFLTQLFDPTQTKINVAPRGFYFTSATQQGAPIDQLRAAFAESFGAEPAATPALSGKSKSFFIEDLIKKMAIGEAGLVSTGRVGHIAARAAYASLFVVAPLVLGALWMSYVKNSDRIAKSAEAAAKYRARAGDLGASDIVSDHDLSKVLPALHALRYLPGGFTADRSAAEAVSGGFGLSQAARLRSAAETAYGVGLERLLRPRLVARLEEQLGANAQNPTALFETLQAYLMLGGLEPVDRQALTAWLGRDWSKNLYPGAKNAAGRKELEQHLAAMLDLETGRGAFIGLNGPLVEKAQAALARVNVADRAYQLLAARAKTSQGDDWAAIKAAGPEALVVFDKAIETIRAPYFHTKAGFDHAFMDQLPTTLEEMARLRRILGAAGEQPEVSAQYDRLPQELVDIYVKAFVGSWRGAIDKLKLRRLVVDRPAYPALAAAASASSPLAVILESVRDETLLPDAEAPEAAAVGGTTGETPAQMIDAALQPYHRLVEGEPGRRPIDKTIAQLNDIRANLSRLAAGGAQADDFAAKLAAGAAALQTEASALPQPFAHMMMETAEATTGEAADLAAARIVETLRGAIGPACRDKIGSRYPFARDAKREVGLDDFTQMFGPKGLIDQFASEHVLPAADISGPEWKWREDSALGKRLGPSTLADFQRAAEIRGAFFAAAETAAPGFTFSVTPPAVAAARLDINGAMIAARGRKTAPTTAQWPGPADNRRAALAFQRPGRQPPVIEKTGVWSIYRLIDAGRSEGEGATVFSLGGRDLDYRFESRPASPGASLKPLDLTQIRKFRCPHGG